VSASPEARSELGVGLLLGSLVALVAAAIAAPRVAGDAVSPLAAFALLYSGAALVAAPAVAALRAARPMPRLALAVPAGLLLAAPALLLFARVLKSTTHHRPLGAATFAVGAALVALGAIALATRWLSQGRRSKIALLVLLALAALGTFALSLPLLGQAPGAAFDGLILFGLGAAAGRLPIPERLVRAGKIAGPVAWVAAVALLLLLRDPPARRAAAERAPVLALPAVLFGPAVDGSASGS
jgi:hypothetical protein